MLVRKPRGYWKVKANVLLDAKRFKTRTAWHKASGAAYRNAQALGWYDEAVVHMKTTRVVTPGHWTVKANVAASAAPFDARTKWQQAEPSAYASARRNKWLDDPEVVGHMKKRKGRSPNV